MSVKGSEANRNSYSSSDEFASFSMMVAEWQLNATKKFFLRRNLDLGQLAFKHTQIITPQTLLTDLYFFPFLQSTKWMIPTQMFCQGCQGKLIKVKTFITMITVGKVMKI